MVLAKKKLKEKLRSLLAASVERTESGKVSKASAALREDVNQRLQSLKELLISKNRRDNRPTRKGGKKKKKFPEESVTLANDAAKTVGNEVSADTPAASSSGKKRKRESNTAAESSEQKKENKVKKKKKKKEKKKRKKKKVEKADDKENAPDSSDRKNVEEAATSDAREEDSDAGKKVYVGGIPFYSTDDDIRSFFESCGTVTEIDCMVFPESGKFRGIAILSFKTEAAAKRALALDGSDMGGLFLKIKTYKGPQKQQKPDFTPKIIDGYNRIYVGNLAWEITEDDVRKFFRDCKIASVRFGEDKSTGEFKGYAHVDFHDGASLAAALKLDQVELYGRPAKISCAVPKKGSLTAVPKKGSATAVPKKGGGAAVSNEGDVSAVSTATATTATTAAPPSTEKKKKKKRQTCYECGVPGHLSSECPQKKLDSTN